jgi:hypothetical protein
MVAQKKLKIREGRIFPRSNAPPTTIITCSNISAGGCDQGTVPTHGAGAEKLLVKAIDDLGEDSRARRRGGYDIHHPKRLEASDEGAGISAECERIAPEHPLKRDAVIQPRISLYQISWGKNSLHCNNHQRLEEQSQSRLPPRQPAIEEADPGDDQPDNETAEHDVGVVVFEADILGIDVNCCRIAPVGDRCIEGR